MTEPPFSVYRGLLLLTGERETNGNVSPLCSRPRSEAKWLSVSSVLVTTPVVGNS